MRKPSAFVSYSHVDRDFALRAAKDLLQAGINVWIDKYEISPGDSLIQKIFSEGLSQSDFFLILLSNASTSSKWVREELDTAMVQRIAGATKIIPLVIEDCEIPMPLRSIFYVDLSNNYEDGIRSLVKTMYGVSERPAVGVAPEYVTSLNRSVGGLSKEASTLGLLLLSTKDDEQGFESRLGSNELRQKLPDLTPEEINDAVDELESYGLVKAHKVFGNAPFYFGYVEATYALFLHFKSEGLSYDPEEDIRQVASAVVGKKDMTGDDLVEVLKITPGRINRAVRYLEEYGIVQVIRVLGTAPFDFRDVIATRHTRDFVQRNS